MDHLRRIERTIKHRHCLRRRSSIICWSTHGWYRERVSIVLQDSQVWGFTGGHIRVVEAHCSRCSTSCGRGTSSCRIGDVRRSYTTHGGWRLCSSGSSRGHSRSCLLLIQRKDKSWSLDKKLHSTKYFPCSKKQ